MAGGKFSEWQGRFERFRRAGLSVARFCATEGVSVPSFDQWRKKLSAGTLTGSVGSVSLGSTSSFAAVRLVGAASVAAWLPGGTRLEIPLGDAGMLQLAIETLVRVDAQQAAACPVERAGGVTC
jgi:hypothetical protein